MLLVGAACSKSKPGGGNASPKGTNASRGGIFKVGLLSDVTAGMDPAREYYSIGWGFLRVMNRTLLTYKAAPAPTGNQLVPDIAAALPQESADGLSWTYKLKPNVKFGPPIDRAVVCADVKAAFDRMFTEAGAGGYNFYYTIIEGADDFQNKKSDTISGITCPDDQTITFKLTEPTGDFPFRTAMPATAPIPQAEHATEGHDTDYGRFMVSTGPYMWLGEDKVDFSVGAKDQKPAEGYQPNRSMTLVRNPNWDASTDEVRKAYVDEIDVTIGGQSQDLLNRVQAGELDTMEDGEVSAQVLQAYQTDPTLKRYFYIHPDDGTRYIWLNLTIPPFDDIHVRKAVNWIVNKDALRRLRGGPAFGDVASHIIPPSMAGALPPSFDPYATAGGRGDQSKAAGEMKQSKYDTDQDGVCDAPECKDAFMVTDNADPYPDQTVALQADLKKIGISLKVRALDRSTMYDFYFTPAKKVAIGNGAAWFKDYADMVTFIDPLFNGANIQPTGNVNYSMVNDSTVNGMIAQCKKEVGDERNTCWSNADKYLMENVVPWVPWLWDHNVRVFSTNVATLPVPYNQFAAGTAYDQIALTPDDIQKTKPQEHTG
jgi:peptide/nickel transport system substrate-binding protein